MKYTQKQLESMSDFELNVVAANQFYESGEITTSPAKFGVQVHVNGAFVDDSYNPCGSWSDCGDLIDECNINTTKGSQMCSAVSLIGIEFMQVVDVNIKRAVTITYILIKQGE